MKTLSKHHFPPWLSGSTIRHIRKRNAIFQKANGLQTIISIYHKLRNKVVGMIRLAKKRFYGTLNISNTKQFWKAYKVVNKESNSNSIPTLVQGDTEASTDKQKADLLNTFFSSCWNMSNSPLSSVSLS